MALFRPEISNTDTIPSKIPNFRTKTTLFYVKQESLNSFYFFLIIYGLLSVLCGWQHLGGSFPEANPQAIALGPSTQRHSVSIVDELAFRTI